VRIPDWWEAVLLAAAAWRVFQLIALDEILEGPRRYVTRLGKTWKKDGNPIPKEYREKLAMFLICPYCAGFWIALAWWGAWQIWPTGTLIAATPWLLSAGVIAGHKLLASE
jgi:uncharacterized protein DUF1360